MYDQAKQIINSAKKIVVIQAENPDGDSLGSALALEEILRQKLQEMNLNQELLAQEEIQVLEHQETNHNRELLVLEEMIIQELNQVREEIPNQEWKHQEATHNREEIVKVQEEEEDKLKADLTVGFFVFQNYYLIE